MIPSPQCCILPAQLQWWSVLCVSLLHAVMGWPHPGPLLWVHSCPLQGGGILAPADSLSLLVGGWMGNQILQPAEIEYYFFFPRALSSVSRLTGVFSFAVNRSGSNMSIENCTERFVTDTMRCCEAIAGMNCRACSSALPACPSKTSCGRHIFE